MHRLDLRQVAVTPRLPPVGELAERVDDTTQPIPCFVDRQRRGVDADLLQRPLRCLTGDLAGDGLDDLGRTTARLLERSSSSSEVGMVREYSYNAQPGVLDRIVGRWENSAGGFQDATYTRDAVGNVTTITENVTATATRECIIVGAQASEIGMSRDEIGGWLVANMSLLFCVSNTGDQAYGSPTRC